MATAIDGLISTASHAVVVGVGNVALDVARVLIKSAPELTDTDMPDDVLESHAHKGISEVHILGRRGPAYTSFTTKELRELGQLPGVDVVMAAEDLDLDESSSAVVARDKVAARNVAVMQEWADRKPTGAGKRIYLHFWTRPTRIIGSERVEAVQVERTAIDSDGYVVGTGGGPIFRRSWWCARWDIADVRSLAFPTTRALAGCRTRRDGSFVIMGFPPTNTSRAGSSGVRQA